MKERFLGLINKYRSLRAQRDSGRMSDEEYRSQLEASALQDPDSPNCWWNISPESGLWIFFNGKEWAPRKPEGFDPDVGPITPVPTKTTTIRKSRGPMILALSLVGAAVITGIVVITLMVAQPGSAPTNDDTAKEDIEEILDDLYKALDRTDEEELLVLTSGRLARQVGDEREEGTLANFTQPYRDVRVEIDEIDLNGRQAKAKVQLSRGGRIYEQAVELELENGKWKVVDLGEARLAPQRRAGGDGLDIPSGTREAEVRNLTDQFFQAYKNLDTYRMRSFLTDQALDEFEGFEARLENPEDYEDARDMVSDLTWDFLSIDLSERGDQATVRVKVSSSDMPIWMELKLTNEGWKIAKSGSGTR